MLVVGLTGGIGCGKSLVSDLFQKMYSIPVIDADTISKQLSQSQHVIDEIDTQLGSEFVDINRQLKREKLRRAIFSDPKLRTKLESILHPLVYEEIKIQLAKLNNDYCLVSIPLLLETNRTNFLDRILVVDCSVEEQISRVVERDQCNQEHVEKIIATQIDRDIRLTLANDVIENSGTIQSVEKQIASLHQKYTDISNVRVKSE